MGLKVGTVKVEKYNPEWNIIFLEEKENLTKIFGDVALKIEHVGSTAIDGLSSKPIVDILVVVRNLSDFENLRKNFETDPYSIKEDSEPYEILITKELEDNQTHSIHVMEVSNKKCLEMILFRDYIKTHKEVLKEYEALKKDLAKKYPNNWDTYTKSKDWFIKKVIERAYLERSKS